MLSGVAFGRMAGSVEETEGRLDGGLDDRREGAGEDEEEEDEVPGW